jgi:hypothetical protein
VLNADDYLSKLRTLQNAKFRSVAEAIRTFYQIDNAYKTVTDGGESFQGRASVWRTLKAMLTRATGRNYHRIYKIYTVTQFEGLIPNAGTYPRQAAVLDVIKRECSEAQEIQTLIEHCNWVNIAPGENYERLFVMTCKQGWWNPKSHEIISEVMFTRPNGEQIQKTDVKTVDVAPNSVVLGIFAALWSLFGIAYAFWSKGGFPLSDEIAAKAASSEGFDTNRFELLDFIIIPVFAFAIYNIVEYLKISELVEKLKLSWRTAMIIGIVSGVLFVRLSASITGLLGTH